MNQTSRYLFKKLINQRCFHTTTAKLIDPKNVEEIRIPVPWGHIAGKWWGKKDTQPILALHGWQDNAGSWDPIAELMPDDIPILAIDLPGNGLSSHLPPMQNYYFSDAVGTIQRIKRHFGFGKLDLLGHSGGSAVSFMYSTIFPEEVDTYFGIDYVVHCYKNEMKRAQKIGTQIDKKIEQGLRVHSESRSYSWDEAKHVWIKATNNSLDENSTEILLIRGATKLSNGKYIFSRDHRLKTEDLNVFNQEQVRKLAENIRCHVVLVEGAKSPFMKRSVKNIPDLLEMIDKNAQSFKHVKLDGKHHLHMDIPEQFIPIILELREKKK